MSDEVRTPAPMHRAPTETWRPISWLALAALLACLALALPAIYGLWVLMVVPLVLGTVAVMRVDPATRRGRGMALWAVGLAGMMGIFSFIVHVGMARGADTAVSGVLATLRNGERKHIEGQFDPAARDDGAVQRVIDRYRAVEERYGRYEDVPDAGTPWLGSLGVTQPPQDVTQIGAEGAPPQLTMDLLWLWRPARFERGTVHVGVQIDKTRIQSPAGAIRDVRFFAPRS